GLAVGAQMMGRWSWQVAGVGARVLLCLLLLQRVEAQSPQPGRPQSTAAEQTQLVEDPLGRSTPHGTVVGLMTAAGQDLNRAAEYLDSGLKPPDRRELARQLSVVL